MCRTTYGDLITAARLSETAYEPEAFIRDNVRSWKMQHVCHIANAGTFATVSIDHRGVMWLAFRGTQISEWMDINADRKFLPTIEGTGLAHRGFVAALEAIWLLVEQKCAEHPGRLVVTGHSLGAALAKLAARRLGVARRKSGLSKPDVITFGCPLVGSPSWNRSFAWSCGDVVRVTNGGDPIPWMFGWPAYHHENLERIHLDGEGNVVFNPSTFRQLRSMPCGKIKGITRFCRAVWQTRSLFRAWLQVTSVLDHAIHRYRGQLVELFESRSDESID